MQRTFVRLAKKMATSPTYKIVVLPNLRHEPEPEPNLLRLAEKFFELRMKALQKSADAFASKYETEVKDGPARSLSRLTNAKAVHFVAMKTPGGINADTDVNSIESILASDWVGFNVLLGPEEGSELSVPSANLDPFPRMTATGTTQSGIHELVHRPAEHDELHFHINGMYVDASARGAGLGRKLMDAALDRAKLEATNVKVRSRVSLSVYSHNVAAMKLYEASGFKVLKTEKSRSRPEYVAIHMELVEPAVTNQYAGGT